MPIKAKSTAVETIEAIKTRRIIVKVVGTSPLIMHRFSFKARQELLSPSPKKNASERASTLKHNPPETAIQNPPRCSICRTARFTERLRQRRSTFPAQPEPRSNA